MDSPIGTLVIEENGEAITALYNRQNAETTKAAETQTEARVRPPVRAGQYTNDCEDDSENDRTELLQEAKKQLQEYFAGKRQAFDLPIYSQGTEFQQKVWGALRQIPYGETRSYGEIAAQVGNPKASRAVGGANNKNPIMIIVPCHRVVGADGSLVGFGGGLYAKEYLLSLEKKYHTWGKIS